MVQAALGGEFEAPTIDGAKTRVKVPEGTQSGLLHDSLVSCNNLATIEQRLVIRKIGSLPPAAMAKVDDCLRAALGL